MGKETTSEMVKYEFTEDELTEFRNDMAQKVSQVEDLETQKKSAAARFDSDIKQANLSIRESARRIRDGYEMRYMRCTIERDYAAGVVRYYREDNDELVKTRSMNVEERQMKIDDAA